MTRVTLPDWTRSLTAGQGVVPGDQPAQLPAHVGLWLDRFLDRAFEAGGSGWPARDRLYEAAVRALRPAGNEVEAPPALRSYRQLFARWQRALLGESPGTYRRTVVVEAKSRLLLHPASGESVTEGALLLHHTYGVPYLPGSALKGITRSWLLARGSTDEQELGSGLAPALLGYLPAREAPEEEGHAALIDLLDALWVPEPCSGGEGPLALDTSTPHHPDYSTKPNGSRPEPSPGDSPIPVPRLTVRPGARFQLVAECAADLAGWCDWLVDQALLPALEDVGLGAASSAGYGRFRALDARRAVAKAEDAKPSRPVDEPVRWTGALVRWDPSKQQLHVTHEGERAFADRGSSALLVAGLSEAARIRLTSKKRECRLGIEVVKEGTAWKIVTLIEQGGG